MWKSMFSHDTPKRCKFVALLGFEAGFLMMRPKTKCSFDALLRFVAGFLMTRQKLLYLMHYYTEKQVFSWRAKKVQICCIITWKSRFSHDATQNKLHIWCIITLRSRFSHDAPKLLYFIHYYTGKQVFSWRDKSCKFVALLRGKAGFLITQPKAKCTFDALLRFVAGFLMKHQKVLYLIHYYVEKQGFSWRTKNVQIYWIITRKSRFSYGAPKTLIFDT